MKVNIKRLSAAVAVVSIGLAPLVACGGASGDEVVTLNFTSQYGPGSFFGDSQERWMAEVEELSDGTIEFQRFWSGSLVGAAETLPGIAQGRADLGFVAQPYFTAELPLSNASYLPQFDTDVAAMTNAFAELYESNEALQEEWESQNLVALAWNPVVPMGLGAREPMNSVSDLQGATVRSSGTQTLAYQEMGVGTAAIASEETYEALQRGTIDAWAGLTIDGTAAMGFPEVAPHLLAFPEFYSAISSPIAINKDVWESLTDDQRSVLQEASSNYHEYSIEMAMEYEEEGCQAYLDAGGSVTMLSDAEREDWMARGTDIMTQFWYDSSAESGLPREQMDAFVEELEEAVARHAEDSSYVDGFIACMEQQDN